MVDENLVVQIYFEGKIQSLKIPAPLNQHELVQTISKKFDIRFRDVNLGYEISYEDESLQKQRIVNQETYIAAVETAFQRVLKIRVAPKVKPKVPKTEQPKPKPAYLPVRPKEVKIEFVRKSDAEIANPSKLKPNPRASKILGVTPGVTRLDKMRDMLQHNEEVNQVMFKLHTQNYRAIPWDPDLMPTWETSFNGYHLGPGMVRWFRETETGCKLVRSNYLIAFSCCMQLFWCLQCHKKFHSEGTEKVTDKILCLQCKRLVYQSDECVECGILHWYL